MKERHYLSDLRGWNTRRLQGSIPHVAPKYAALIFKICATKVGSFP